jgi:hypothetical protein
VLLLMPHINHFYVLFSTNDFASHRRFNPPFNSCLRYVHAIPRREHVSHLVPIPNIIDVSLATHKIHLLTFLFKVLHSSCTAPVVYFFTLFHFASSARTRNLIVTSHRSLAIHCGGNSLSHRIKMSVLWGASSIFE